MDNFSIGDKVIYPNQGIGVVEDIQKEKYFGQEFHIYHLRIVSNDSKIMVPSSNTEEIGIRRLISLDTIREIYDFMRSGAVDVSMNWKGRYKEHVNLMKTGTIQDMAMVLKSLFYLNLVKPLSFREKKMMEKAKELLVTEISEVLHTTTENTEQQLLNGLSDCFKNVSAQLDS
ncbi:MAG: CarD family transcriptional regulator [Candidatus Aminicenantaceae bacterium]|jgi:CarD family transcriptional regulator